MTHQNAEADSDELPEAQPFLKWAGGKKQLLPELFRRMPKRLGRYYEPFIGGGALFFKLGRIGAYISDSNAELINCYQVVRSEPQKLLNELRLFPHQQDFFYEIRNADRQPDYANWSRVRRAARLIFLNRTCFNGLYRVNSKGQFNVPFGDYKNPRIVDPKNIFACSRLLAQTEICCANYLAVEEAAQEGDFVYFDPPYAVLSATSNFTSYTKEGFGMKDQQELFNLCKRLDKRGVFWMLSNSSAVEVAQLYERFNVCIVPAKRNINSDSSKRGAIGESIICNYDVDSR